METPPQLPAQRIRRTRRAAAVGSAATLAGAWVVVAGLGRGASPAVGSTAPAGLTTTTSTTAPPAPAPAPEAGETHDDGVLVAPDASTAAPPSTGAASAQSALPPATTRQS
jgi:hypothetical protein